MQRRDDVILQELGPSLVVGAKRAFRVVVSFDSTSFGIIAGVEVNTQEELCSTGIGAIDPSLQIIEDSVRSEGQSVRREIRGRDTG